MSETLSVTERTAEREISTSIDKNENVKVIKVVFSTKKTLISCSM